MHRFVWLDTVTKHLHELVLDEATGQCIFNSPACWPIQCSGYVGDYDVVRDPITGRFPHTWRCRVRYDNGLTPLEFECRQIRWSEERWGQCHFFGHVWQPHSANYSAHERIYLVYVGTDNHPHSAGSSRL